MVPCDPVRWTGPAPGIGSKHSADVRAITSRSDNVGAWGTSKRIRIRLAATAFPGL